MKKALCILLCLMLALSSSAAETADTLQKLMVRQLTAGYGVRGYATLTANGVAEWLTYLLPLTATDIQIRGIGEKQGTVSQSIEDDDDWQVRFYAKNAEGDEVGTTWLYGNPDGVYIQSELLPETVLSIPVEGVHLLYQLMRGDYQQLFFAFDPMNLRAPGENGNASAYEGIANVMGIAEDEWNEKWMPVLEKYFLHLDLWLMAYGDPEFITSESGSLSMTGTYTIPAADFKKQAKYLIGQMIYDNQLQELLIPYVTMEQRITYLNPSMVYFYEACIDALPLEGDIVLSREMSAMGENVSTTIALPLPPLPEKLTAPVGDVVQNLLGVSYGNILSGMNRIAVTQQGSERIVILSGEQRSIEIAAQVNPDGDNAFVWSGSVRVTPNIGVNEEYLSVTFTCRSGHQVWQDESFNNHDTTEFSLSVQPDLVNLADDDPFRSAYLDFAPISLDLRLNYRNDPYKDNSPVQLNMDLALKLPDAEVVAAVVLRITTQMQMETLSTVGAEDLNTMTADKKDELLNIFLQNLIKSMANLNTQTIAEDAAEMADQSANE